jgi:hypothetical protein
MYSKTCQESKGTSEHRGLRTRGKNKLIISLESGVLRGLALIDEVRLIRARSEWEKAERLRLERGPDPAGDTGLEQVMSHRKRVVERDCECVCGIWEKLTDRNQKIFEVFLASGHSLHFRKAREGGS